MNNRKQQIDDFFEKYSERFNKAIQGNVSDIEQAAEMYSDCFIAANPEGVNCGKNDKQLLEVMQKGYEFYKNIGITFMAIASKEITLLDDFHTMIKVRWRSNFIKKDGSKDSIEFDNIYFTQTREDQHKVFAWITGDEH